MVGVVAFVMATEVGGGAWAAPFDEGFSMKPGRVSEMTRYVDLICDGKTVAITVRNDAGMRDAVKKGVEANGSKLMSSMMLAQSQVYPLGMKVGDELPAFRSYNMMVVERPPADRGTLLNTADWTQMLMAAVTSKMATGTQLVTMNIKVAGQESCDLPGGGKVPCWRITKQMFSAPHAHHRMVRPRRLSHPARDRPAGHPIITMALTDLERPAEPTPPALTPPPAAATP